MDANVRKHTVNALVAAGISAICALLAAAFTDLGSPWYSALDKPVFLPADDILSGCWAGVALASAVALFLCFTFGGINGRAAYLFAFTMALAAMWHYVFFQGGFIVYGFYTLTLAIAVSIYANFCMFKRHLAAGLLSLPLPLWLCFLAALNYMVFMLN